MADTPGRTRGLSVLEISKRLAAARGRTIDPGPTIGPRNDDDDTISVGKLQEWRNSRILQRMADAEVSEIEAESETRKSEAEVKKLETEVKTLEAKSRLDELLAKTRSNGELDPAVALLIETLREREQVSRASAGAGMSDAVMMVLEKVVDQLAEMKSQVQDIATGRETKDPVATLVGNITGVKELRELIEGLFPNNNNTAIANTRHDLEITMIAQKNQLEIERMKQQFSLDQMRVRKELELKEREVEIEKQRVDGLRAGIEGFITSIAPIARDLVTSLTHGGNGVGMPAADFSPHVVEAPRPMQVVPKAIAVTCANDDCKQTIYVQEGDTEARCGYCGASFTTSWEEEKS